MTAPDGTSFIRVGLGIITGAEIDLASGLSLDVTARYSFTNAFHAGEESLYRTYFNRFNFGVSILYDLLPQKSQ